MRSRRITNPWYVSTTLKNSTLEGSLKLELDVADFINVVHVPHSQKSQRPLTL